MDIIPAASSTAVAARWKELETEEKKIVIQEEMKRMNKLPANSNYAVHRLRVLNKILQLLSVPRTISMDEELELLFAGLRL
ncbi:hypothetical protein LINPERPRIM_LOCUS28954 [Linum perenne]